MFPHSVLIPIAALIVITGGLVHGIWYAVREHRKKREQTAARESN